MTDFQLSLMGGGAIFLAAVLIYNKWQEYRAKKSVDKAFSAEHDDVLMQAGMQTGMPAAKGRTAAAREAFGDANVAPGGMVGERVEPTFQDDAVAGMHAESGFEPRMEPAVGQAAAVTSAPLLDDDEEALDAVIGGLLDPIIDCLIPLVPESAVAGKAVLPLQKNLQRAGDKAVQLVGLHRDGHWEPIAAEASYVKLLVGVQMASRASALNELEFSELVMRVRSLADEIGAEPEVPDMRDVMANARALHRFVLDHDAQLGINVQSNGAPWAINSLLVSLEKQGFDFRADGSFVMPDGDGAYLYSINTNAPLSAATTSRLTLLLDAPRVMPARDAFGAMTACAKSLAARLGATVVDDGNQALQDQTLGEIGQQLVEFYNEMQEAEIAAGSMRALRLFS